MANHLQIQCDLPTHDEVQLHDFFLHQTGLTPNIMANGKGSAADQLAQLLTTKGATEQHVQERAQMVIDKVGQSQVQQALRSNNPWATLKAAASKPGRIFAW